MARAQRACPTHDATLDRVKAVLADPAFPRNNPNRLRSLVGTFAMSNPVQFARPDGEGFRFVTEFVADVDKRNPQVAARVLTAFRVWPQLRAGPARGRRICAQSAARIRWAEPEYRRHPDPDARRLMTS